MLNFQPASLLIQWTYSRVILAKLDKSVWKLKAYKEYEVQVKEVL